MSQEQESAAFSGMKLETPRSLLDDPQHSIFALKKILVPHDFSPPSRKAFKYACRFAKEFGSHLILLHVLEPVSSRNFMERRRAPAFSEKELTSAEKNLRVLLSSAELGGLKETRSALRTGIPSHEIVEAAKDFDVDLIVIATHGYTGWKHFCIGSTAERVVRAAPCPVMVVREKEHEFIDQR
jgi:nucleotide-binding universal stress UspA family protein